MCVGWTVKEGVRGLEGLRACPQCKHLYYSIRLGLYVIRGVGLYTLASSEWAHESSVLLYIVHVLYIWLCSEN
jgi:hypothetical protein